MDFGVAHEIPHAFQPDMGGDDRFDNTPVGTDDFDAKADFFGRCFRQERRCLEVDRETPPPKPER